MTTRRDILRLGAALPFLGVSSAWAAAPSRRTLVLVELNGGNDGLNTLVPYADPAYARLRPRLALPREQLWTLTERLALHDQLAALKPAWDARELAIVAGVGYADPNRSHFRSIEIWNGATDSDRVARDGWIAALPGVRGRGAVDGVTLGGPSGPLTGAALRSVNLQNPGQFLRKADRLTEGVAEAENPALAHVLRVRTGAHRAAEAIRKRLGAAQPNAVRFPRSKIGRQLAIAARLLASGEALPVIKVQHSGFDTHANQQGKHARLLRELAEALMAFRAALKGMGRWRDTLICTYAEFGRRPKENGSRGTDHGTAAPHFMLGGGVKGGLYGQQPSLTDLQGGDLKHHVDYRRLYATAGRFLGGQPPARFGKPVPCLRG